MDNQSFDISAARIFQQRKREKRKLSLEKRYNNACADFQNIVNMIIKKYNPHRIYQWGSLIQPGGLFMKEIDPDIAVLIAQAENTLEIINQNRQFYLTFKE